MMGYIYIPRVHTNGKSYREDLYQHDITGQYIAVDKITYHIRYIKGTPQRIQTYSISQL